MCYEQEWTDLQILVHDAAAQTAKKVIAGYVRIHSASQFVMYRGAQSSQGAH